MARSSLPNVLWTYARYCTLIRQCPASTGPAPPITGEGCFGPIGVASPRGADTPVMHVRAPQQIYAACQNLIPTAPTAGTLVPTVRALRTKWQSTGSSILLSALLFWVAWHVFGRGREFRTECQYTGSENSADTPACSAQCHAGPAVDAKSRQPQLRRPCELSGNR